MSETGAFVLIECQNVADDDDRKYQVVFWDYDKNVLYKPVYKNSTLYFAAENAKHLNQSLPLPKSDQVMHRVGSELEQKWLAAIESFPEEVKSAYAPGVLIDGV